VRAGARKTGQCGANVAPRRPGPRTPDRPPVTAACAPVTRFSRRGDHCFQGGVRAPCDQQTGAKRHATRPENRKLVTPERRSTMRTALSILALVAATTAPAFAGDLDTNDRETMNMIARLDPNDRETMNMIARLDPNDRDTMNMIARLDPNDRDTMNMIARLDQNDRDTMNMIARLDPNDRDTMNMIA
jgi:hypothetical protein